MKQVNRSFQCVTIAWPLLDSSVTRWRMQRCLYSYRQRQTGQSDSGINANCDKKYTSHRLNSSQSLQLFFIATIIIIIIIIIIIVVFAGVLFVYQSGANHAPRASATRVNHSIHTLSTFLRICADPSTQIFWISVTVAASNTFFMFSTILLLLLLLLLLLSIFLRVSEWVSVPLITSPIMFLQELMKEFLSAISLRAKSACGRLGVRYVCVIEPLLSSQRWFLTLGVGKKFMI